MEKLEELTMAQLRERLFAINDEYMSMLARFGFPLYRSHPEFPSIKYRLNSILQELQRRRKNFRRQPLE